MEYAIYNPLQTRAHRSPPVVLVSHNSLIYVSRRFCYRHNHFASSWYVAMTILVKLAFANNY